MNKILEGYFKFIRKMLLSLGETGVIGLDIASGACRAVELRRGKSGLEVVRWAVESIDGLDEKKALGRIIEKLGPSGKTLPVIVGISGKGTLIRLIEMPRMSHADLRKAFVMEADKHFPFPKDTVYTDCFPLTNDAADKKMPVLVAAIKKDIIEGRMKTLKEFGVEPAGITIASIAVANAFMALTPPTCAPGDLGGKAVAIVDIGENLTTLVIISDGAPRFTRDIFMGTSDIARRLTSMAGVSLPQARSLCAGEGDTASRAADILKCVEAVLPNLVTEIRVSLDYFKTEKKVAVGRICLIGDGPYVPGLESVFAGSFDIPLVVWDPAAGMSVGAEREAFLKEGRRSITALGLAAGEYD